jgi:hypothetical protein
MGGTVLSRVEGLFIYRNERVVYLYKCPSCDDVKVTARPPCPTTYQFNYTTCFGCEVVILAPFESHTSLSSYLDAHPEDT